MAVELITGALFVLVFWKIGGIMALQNVASFSYFANLFLLFTLMSLLVVIGGYDIKHKIIPDVFAYSFAALALVKLIFLPEFIPAAWDFLAGPILAFPFAFLWFVSDGRWMGLGDAKLSLGIGWFLGLKAGVAAVILAFWAGAIFGLAIIGIGKIEKTYFLRGRVTMKSEIPFAPFLVGGLLLVFFVPSVMDTMAKFLILI